MKTPAGSTSPESQKKAPVVAGPGLFEVRMASIAAVYQAPAGSPRRRGQSPHIAAAVAIGGSADEQAWTAEAPAAAMPATVPAVTAPGGSGSRRQSGHAQRGRGNCNKREFA